VVMFWGMSANEMKLSGHAVELLAFRMSTVRSPAPRYTLVSTNITALWCLLSGPAGKAHLGR
jgi:hypothetical protein